MFFPLLQVPQLDPSVSMKQLADRIDKEKMWRLKRDIRFRQEDPEGNHVIPMTSANVGLDIPGEEQSPFRMDPILEMIGAQYEVWFPILGRFISLPAACSSPFRFLFGVLKIAVRVAS